MSIMYVGGKVMYSGQTSVQIPDLRIVEPL